MIVRFAASIAVGTAVTFGLLFVMQFMIATGRGAVTDAKRVSLVDFVRVERAQTLEAKDRKAERPPKPESQPELPRPDMSADFDAVLAVAVSTPPPLSSLSVGGVRFGVSDGEYLPIVKVEPVYPMRALTRRLEGWVMVEFTVTETGAVRDVVVIESTASLFEEPAIEAALKFKYKPRVIDGSPVEVPGVRNKIVFTMAAAG